MKKLSKIFAVALVLTMALSVMSVGAAATTTEKCVELTVTSLNLQSQKYSSTSATTEDANDVELTAPVAVDGVSFDFIQVGNYGDGLQMRDKDGKTSKLWNTTAFAGGITKIEFTISSTKSAYDNPDCMILTFGDDVKGATYSTKLSTVKDTKNYTITPDAETYEYFYLEWDLSYTSYWDSIKIYYNETVEDDTTTGDSDDTGDSTSLVLMMAVMALSVFGMVAVVTNKKTV